MRVNFKYPLFDHDGDEILVDVTAHVDFAHDAERDEFGRETECSSGESAEILSTAIEDCDWLPVAALPDWLIKKIEDAALEAAHANVEP